MTTRKSSHFITLSKSFISNPLTKEKYKEHPKDFTRNRKLPFEVLILCMLKLVRKSLALELHRFFSQFSDASNKKMESVTSSAFVQSRQKLKPDLFYDLNHLIADEYYVENDEKVSLYKGHRVLAIDGSTIELPNSKELKAHYGTHNNQNKTNDVVIGRVSVLYDVLNHIVLDGMLRPFSCGEISLCRQHFEYVKPDDLVVMDRGYPSFESVFLLKRKGAHFIFRCKQAFNNQVKAFYQSGKSDELVVLIPKQDQSFKNKPYDKNQRLEVRLIRIELPSGETEILMTSLLDKVKYPHSDFEELYFQRWGIETYYDRFKNIIGVENFSGITHRSVQQDFNCALYISNMQTIIIEDAQIEAQSKYSHRAHEYKINTSLSLGFMRDSLVEIYASNNPDQALEQLKQLLLVHVVPIRPGRKYPREPDKYRKRKKPKAFNNRKNIF